MVELHSLGELEAYLEGERFFGADGVVADVFLHYGLSAALLRTSAAPPEPCRLPLVACRIRREDERPRAAGPYSLGDWERSWDDAGYAEAQMEACLGVDIPTVQVKVFLASKQAEIEGLVPLAPAEAEVDEAQV